eukprot:3818487-Amphidinium_carterae.1
MPRILRQASGDWDGGKLTATQGEHMNSMYDPKRRFQVVVVDSSCDTTRCRLVLKRTELEHSRFDLQKLAASERKTVASSDANDTSN